VQRSAIVRCVDFLLCVLPDADMGPLHECRAADDDWIEIECPRNYIIEIQSADTGYVHDNDVTTMGHYYRDYEDQCEGYYEVCPLSSQEHLPEIEKRCNERHHCSVPRHFFNDNSCDQYHPDPVNRISYKCIESKLILILA